MKKIIEKLKKINSAISYYKNGNKKKEKLNIVEEEKEIFEISDKNNITIERQSFDASNEGNSKEDDINREQTFNEDRKKSLSEQTKDLFRNEKNLTILATIASVSIFIFQAYKSWNISNEYGIPIDSIKIDIKAPSLFMSLISIPILLSIVMCFSKKEYDRLNKIMFHTILIFSSSNNTTDVFEKYPSTYEKDTEKSLQKAWLKVGNTLKENIDKYGSEIKKR